MESGIAIPTDILNEIIAYLWNDIPSLKACSLAHRSFTDLSQKRLFYTICLGPPGNLLNANTSIFLDNKLTGTSYDFWRLLVRSPHIADYVQSLLIYDPYYHRFSPPVHPPAIPLDDKDSTALLYEGYRGRGHAIILQDRKGRRSTYVTHWLTHDEYLPYCALRLQNLKALTLDYDNEWNRLPSQVYIALLRLMRLPSLLSVRIKWGFPVDLFHIAIGDNVKHLALRSGFRDRMLSILPQDPSTQRLYIKSLEISYNDYILDLDLQNPNCRIDMSRLRKLVVTWHGNDGDSADYASIWAILQICRQTLEEFEFIPFTFYPMLLPSDGLDRLDPIDLSKLISLKKLRVHSPVSAIALRYLNNILLPSNNAAPLSVEDISIILSNRYGADDLRPAHLKNTFDVLLDRRFSTLKIFSLFFEHGSTSVPDLVDVLDGSEMVETLRSRRGVVVDIRACRRSSLFETDVRWKTACWKKWNHVGVHEDCLLDTDE